MVGPAPGTTARVIMQGGGLFSAHIPTNFATIQFLVETRAMLVAPYRKHGLQHPLGPLFR
jgi:hypothetical protein